MASCRGVFQGSTRSPTDTAAGFRNQNTTTAFSDNLTFLLCLQNSDMGRQLSQIYTLQIHNS